MSDGKEDSKREQPKGEAGGSWVGAPQHYGNQAGEKVQGTLGKVGEPVGKGLSYAAAPVGSIVDPVVGGVMRSGELAHDSPKEDGSLDDKVRQLAGRVTGQGQEETRKGQEVKEGDKQEKA
ncbi:MAG: hypothetical protein Q9163_006139 [Psora crenata]